MLTIHLKCPIYQPSNFAFFYSPMKKHTLSKQTITKPRKTQKQLFFLMTSHETPPTLWLAA